MQHSHRLRPGSPLWRPAAKADCQGGGGVNAACRDDGVERKPHHCSLATARLLYSRYGEAAVLYGYEMLSQHLIS